MAADNKESQSGKNKSSRKAKSETENGAAIVKAEPVEAERVKEKPERAEAEVVPVEALENMPPEIRQTLQSYFALFSKTTTSGPRPNPLFEKFTESHIDKYLDYVQRDYDHDYELKKTNRWFYLAYVCIALFVFALAVIYLLPKDKEILMSLITLIVAIGGGIGGGYGLSKRNKE